MKELTKRERDIIALYRGCGRTKIGLYKFLGIKCEFKPTKIEDVDFYI